MGRDGSQWCGRLRPGSLLLACSHGGGVCARTRQLGMSDPRESGGGQAARPQSSRLFCPSWMGPAYLSFASGPCQPFLLWCASSDRAFCLPRLISHPWCPLLGWLTSPRPALLCALRLSVLVPGGAGGGHYLRERMEMGREVT